MIKFVLLSTEETKLYYFVIIQFNQALFFISNRLIHIRKQVQLCEATGLAELLGDDFLVNRMASKTMLVAVKMLRPNADHQAR